MASNNNLNFGWVSKIKICHINDSTNSISIGKFQNFDWKAPLSYSEASGLQLQPQAAPGKKELHLLLLNFLKKKRQAWETYAKTIIPLRIRIVHNWGRKWNDKEDLHWN